MRTAGILGWNDCDSDGGLWSAFERDLRCEACAETTVLGEGQICQALKNRGFPTRLIATNNNLWKRDVVTDVALEQAVNLLQPLLSPPFPLLFLFIPTTCSK